MCAKKKAAPRKMWRLAGEPIRSQPLSGLEREAFAEEFSIFRQFRSGTELGSGWVSPAAARIHQGAAEAVASALCERYSDRYGREAVIKVVSAATAVPAPISERVARSADFLLGAALWLLDYWELHCGSEEEYLSLLPPEPDELLEYDIPFSEDLEHSRDVLLRTLMLLRGRDGAYRREFRALLELLDDDAATGLRQRFKAAFLDYVERALEVYDRLQPTVSEPPSFWGETLPDRDFLQMDDLPPSENPETIALLMGPELICRPVAEVQAELGSRKAAELLSGYGTDDPYALCAAYLLLEREKDALANLNCLTAIVMICAERHLPWTQDDFDARAGLFEPGGPDYRLRHEYHMFSEDEPDGDDTPDWLVSEAQLFYIATGVIPPRDQQLSGELVRWFTGHGIGAQRARELAYGAMFAYYTDAGEHGWKPVDWAGFEGDDGNDPPAQAEEIPPASDPDEDPGARAETLARKVKELRGALHDAERAAGRLREQLRETEQRGDAERGELAQLRETLYRLRSGEDADAEESGPPVALPWQVKRRVVVYGGHDSWRKLIKPMLPGARFYDREELADLNVVRGADVVWLQVNAMSHKYYCRIIDAARKNGIPVRYFGSASAKRCAVQLALDELAAEKAE